MTAAQHEPDREAQRRANTRGLVAVLALIGICAVSIGAMFAMWRYILAASPYGTVTVAIVLLGLVNVFFMARNKEGFWKQ